MTLEEAKKVLDDCQRDELRDHAFGDAEVSWMRDGEEVASGYFGSTASVSFYKNGTCKSVAGFEGEDARKLRWCGNAGVSERNDSTGPGRYWGA